MEAEVIAAAAIAGGLAGWAAARLACTRRAARLESLASALAAALRGELSQREAQRAASRLLARPRRRYIVFEVVPARFSRWDVETAIYSKAEELLGLVGASDSALKLVLYEEKTGRGVLRVRHTYKLAALAVLGLVREIRGERVMLIPIATTGSIRRARRLLTS